MCTGQADTRMGGSLYVKSAPVDLRNSVRNSVLQLILFSYVLFIMYVLVYTVSKVLSP